MNAIQRSLGYIFVLLYLTICLAHESKVQESDALPTGIAWNQTISPPGGGIWSVTISNSNPQVLYAATHDLNILKSTNAGESWEQLGEKMFGAHIFSNVAVDPNDFNRIYASNGILFMSTDGGNSWDDTPLGSGEDLGIVAIAISSSEPNIIYAGDNSGDIYVSSDYGRSWKLINTLDYTISTTMIVDPNNSELVYIITNNNEEGMSFILKSENGGETFKPLISKEGINSLVLNRAHPESLYFASNDGIYTSSDFGENWKLLSSAAMVTLEISQSNPNVLYSGDKSGAVYTSTNSGEEWIIVHSFAFHHKYDIAIDPTNSDIVYIGFEDGFLKSINGGEHWKSINEGVVDDGIFTLAVDPHNPWRVYVGNFWTRGVFFTEDAGTSWELLDEWRHSEVPDHYPMEIVIDPRDSNIIYITGEYGLKKSTNGKTSWTSLGDELFGGKHVHGLAIDPSNPNILYVGSGKGEEAVVGGHVYKTLDGGQTWQDMKNGFPTKEETNVYVISVAPSAPSIVYAGTNSHAFGGDSESTKGMGVYKTTNAGTSWKAVNNGLLNKNVFALAVDPNNPNKVYAGTGHEHHEMHKSLTNVGLYSTSDGGKNWRYVDSLPRGDVSHIEFHPKNSNIVLVSYGENRCAGCGEIPKGNGIYASFDGGGTWQFVSGSFTPRQQVVMDVIFAGERVYAGTDDGFIIGTLMYT